MAVSWRAVAVLVGALVALGSIGSATAGASGRAVGAGFFDPPKKLPHGSHGTLIRERPYDGPSELQNGKNTLLLYKQRGIHHQVVATSGYVAVPRARHRRVAGR